MSGLMQRLGLLAANALRSTSRVNIEIAKRISSRSNQLLKPIRTPLKIGDRDSVNLKFEEVLPSYQLLIQRYQKLMLQATIAATVSPSLSALWLAVTEQQMAESYGPLVILGIGSLTIAERALQAYRVNQYAELSITSSSKGPAASSKYNDRIHQMVAGESCRVRLTTAGLKINGIVGDLGLFSQVQQQNNEKIRRTSNIIIPDCVLNIRSKKLANLVFDRWLAQHFVPFSILSTIAISFKHPELDDYLFIGVAMLLLGKNGTHVSYPEAKKNLTKALSKCRTPEQISHFFIEKELLHSGGMSFLNEWNKGIDRLEVRIGRTGSVVLSLPNDIRLSGGPYTQRFFPRAKIGSSPYKTKHGMFDLEGNISNNNQLTRK